jgi:O-antigen ligase
VRIPFLSEANGVRLATASAVLVGGFGGLLAGHKPSVALILCVLLAGVVFLALLGDRAFPACLVVVAVAPWYPFVSAEAAEAPIVKQKVLCAAVAAATLAPWLWSVALGGRTARPKRWTLLLGILTGGLAVLVYTTLGHLSAIISSGIIGYLFIGVTFLCARRFAGARGWPTAAFAGLMALLLMGLAAYVQAPANRVGSFVGYPITYGALVVGLVPLALLFAYRRSRALTGALAALTAVLLIFCQSRSSWVAVAVMLVVTVLVQARAGRFKALAAMASIVGILTVLVLSTSSLHHIVEEKLSEKQKLTQSVTHREWSYGFAVEKISKAPVLGAGYPGYASAESANRTTIGAIDNGYLSITVDMGLVGLLAAFIPIAVALRAIGRCLRLGATPELELAFALGILGMAIVTIFYDSFYWAQIDMLLAAMGGVLSTRIGQISAPATSRARASARRRRRRTRAGAGSWGARTAGWQGWP